MTLLTELSRRAKAFAKKQPFYGREAALCVPAMPLILAVTLVTGGMAYGAVAAGAAFSVGFGASRDLRGWRWAAMIGCCLGASLMAFIGVLAGHSEPLLIALAAAAAAVCAILALFDDDIWWIWLQMVIALLVGGYFYGDLHAAILRSSAVLAGGSCQILIVMILARLFPNAAGRLPPGPRKEKAPRKLIVTHALRAAACVGTALAAAHYIGISNAYWAPMTAMLILKPGLSETHVRGMARLTGTVIGCVAATLFAIGVGYDKPALVLGVALTAGAAFALQKAHYAVLTSFVTATVVLLLSIAHSGSVVMNARHRLVATLLGGVIALLIARIAPHRAVTAAPKPDVVGAR